MKNKPQTEKLFKICKKYLEIDWSLIPIGKNKKPLCSWKEFQTHKATEEQLLEWCNLPDIVGFAVVTGKISGVFVLDIDNDSEFETISLPKTPYAKTGSGGFHYYFLYPENKELKNTTGFQKNTDTRGEGGYAILPPSLHDNGNNYEWIIEPFSTALADIPSNILNQVESPKTKDGLNNENTNIFSGVREGSRNSSAAKIIGKLLRKFREKDWDTEVWELVKAWNEKNIPPLSEIELEKTFKSIKKKDTEKSENRSTSQSHQIINLITQKNIERFLNQFNEPCIVLPENNFVVQKIKSEKTSQLLSQLFWSSENQVVKNSSIAEAIENLQGLARYENPQTREVHNRIGKHNGNLYYDIGDDKHVVKISENGWEVTAESPILFEKFGHQKSQVIPEKNGDLKTFLKFANVSSEEKQLLLLTHLVVSFIPDIPRYVLALNGDPGSAKSTLLREIRELVDPSSVPLFTPPRNDQELIQIASHNYAIFLDNLSGLTVQTSDALCRFVTGDGFSKRQLYTDDCDILYSFKRLVGICGVNQVATKPDLLSRCLIINLDYIEDSDRKEEAVLWQEFEKEKPKILGAIFDCLSYCLRVAPTLDIKTKPRMADHFRYATAASQFLEYKEFDLHNAIKANTKNQSEEALEASDIAPVIIDFMADKDLWEGTSSKLHAELQVVAQKLKIKIPKTPSWLWKKINEVKTNLRTHDIKASRSKGSAANIIKLLKTSNGSMEAVEANCPF